MNSAKPAALICLCVLLVPGVAACTDSAVATESDPPAVVREVPGSNVKEVTLTEDAVAAAGIATAPVTRTAPRELRIPYAAVIYYLDGTSWAYRVVSRNTFVRVPIHILAISGQFATLTEGPPVGSRVVVVGAPEILGAELDISGEQ